MVLGDPHPGEPDAFGEDRVLGRGGQGRGVAGTANLPGEQEDVHVDRPPGVVPAVSSHAARATG
jgi:hypothetical protein